MDLLQLQDNLRNIDIWELLIPIIEKHLPEIEELNREQLKAGKRADGSDTDSHSGSRRSEKYIDDKIRRGVYDPSIYPSVNLYDTGKFQRGITAKLDMMYGIHVDSTDFKAEGLEERYGSTIYGLTDDSLDRFIEKILPELDESINNKIFEGV